MNIKTIVAARVTLLSVVFVPVALAQSVTPMTFASPGDAAGALAEAARAHDDAGLQAILGAGIDVISSGEASMDALERDRFAQKYDQMHRLVRESDGQFVLYIGAENWPFPIPLASKAGRWTFDTAAGQNEILYRTIGENEANAEALCRRSAAGSEGDAPGYIVRVLDSSGLAATGTGGTRPREKTIKEIVMVVYPSAYRITGVMTFITTTEGRVYMKDLGPDTPVFARGLNRRVYAAGWRAVN